MKNFIKNILLLVAVFILSYFTASYFGALYDKFSPQYDFSFFNLQKDQIIFLAGLPVAYVFFVPFLFELFGGKSKVKWTAWLLVPPALFWISADKYYIYVPIILAIIAFYLAKLINLIISKIRRA
jgi:nitrate/nitrite transporter NarK